MRFTSRLGRPRSRHRASSSPISGIENPSLRARRMNLEFVKIALAVIAVVVGAPIGRTQQADRLVMADHFGGDSARGRRRADVHCTNPLDLPMMGRFIPSRHGTQPPFADRLPRGGKRARQGPGLRHVGRPGDGQAQSRARGGDDLLLLCRMPRKVRRRARRDTSDLQARAIVRRETGVLPEALGPRRPRSASAATISSRHALGRDLHLPDASADPPGSSRRLPDLRHGARAGSRRRRRPGRAPNSST